MRYPLRPRCIPLSRRGRAASLQRAASLANRARWRDRMRRRCPVETGTLAWASVLTPEPERSGNALAEAENELRVVGHPVRRPRGVERQLQLDVLDALDLAD